MNKINGTCSQEVNESGAAEAVEPKRPLTEEEKRERLLQMEELRKKKRAEREEREKQEVEISAVRRNPQGFGFLWPDLLESTAKLLL